MLGTTKNLHSLKRFSKPGHNDTTERGGGGEGSDIMEYHDTTERGGGGEGRDVKDFGAWEYSIFEYQAALLNPPGPWGWGAGAPNPTPGLG